MNLDLKIQVLENGCYDLYLEYRKLIWFCSQPESNFDVLEQLTVVSESLNDFSDAEIKECLRLYESKRRKFKHLRRQVELGYKRGFVYFGTLTFSDTYLDNWSAATKRQKVSRFLSGLDIVYFANQDFGGKFGREHYHFIMVYPFQVDCSSKSSSYFLSGWNPIGFSSLALVGSEKTDKYKVSEYISKCSNHALKITAQRSNLIYSRKQPTWLKSFI